MQFIDLLLPSIPMNEESKNGDDVVEPPSSTNPVDDITNDSDYSTKQQNKIPVRGTIFFVHGGAWGSGKPWMYRLIAPTFLKLHFAVVIVGYRTYPDAATIDDQVGDVLLAWEKAGDILNNSVTMMLSSATSQCESTRGDACDNDDAGSNICTDDACNGWVGNVIMGHSSGAHVAMLMLVLWIQKQQRQWKNHPGEPNHSRNASDSNYPWDPNYFIGLSGPYDINDHFDYEAGRGVEQISPMKPICGHSREKFHKASPVKRFLSLFREQGDDDSELHNQARSIQQLTPPILLVHGIEDATVPFTATADAGRILRSCGLQRCDEIYLDETGHQDVVVHFMFGGPTKDLTLDWLFHCCRDMRNRSSSNIQSRL
jgi:acetyl esterase/lipase